MQPYFFPYLGYYRLVAAVERFVFYDDVQFIKQGWIARNTIPVNGQPWTFSVPLEGASSNKRIDEVRLDPARWPAWREKFLRTLDQTYGRAANFTEGRRLVADVLATPTDRIGVLAARSVEAVAQAAGIGTHFLRSSELRFDTEAKGEERLLDLCARLGITDYVNAPGGAELYSTPRWRERGIRLRFIRHTPIAYPGPQWFLPGASAIDAIMHVRFAQWPELLGGVELEER